MIDNTTYILITPSPLAFAFGVAGGTAFGVIGGIANHEFTDLRSGFKCVLRNVIVSATVSAIAQAVWSAFVLTAMNTGAVTLTFIIAGCLWGPGVYKWIFKKDESFPDTLFGMTQILVNRYEQMLKIFLDHHIPSPNTP